MIELVAIPVVIIPLAIAYALMVATRGICYFGGNTSTDNEKLVKMAAEISLTAWPSRMHAISYGRGHLREYYVLALKILMNISSMKGSDHVNIVLALITNALSAVLVFYIGRYYFGDIAGLFVFSLYVSSLWSYHVAIIFGHVLLSQALFLMAVLALTLTTALPAASFPLYLAAGVLTGMSFSSSSSSRKFPFLVLVAFLYQSKDFLVLPYATEFDVDQLRAGWAIAAFGGPTLVLIVLAAFGRPIGRALIGLAEAQTGIKRTPERYIELLEFAPRQVRGYATWGITALIFFYLLQPEGRFYANGAVCLAGLGLVAVHILSPKFIPNLLRYRMWMDQTNWLSHFQVWTTHHEEVFGRPLPKNYRGGGITWTPRFLIRMVPIIVIVYVTALLVFAGTTVERISSGDLGMIDGTLVIVALILISLLPIIVSEVSRALQLGKAYFPAFVGLLVLIGAGTSSIVEIVDGHYWVTGLLAFTAAGLVLRQTIMTGRALVSDLIPARMGPDRLYRSLKEKNIQSFYTYNNPYNNSFVESMLYSHPDEFDVTYIDNIKEAMGGIVVVPPTSSKSVDMTSDKYGVENGDFRDDLVLTQLLDTREIERVALAKLDTRGCSRYFVHESEVSTYRDIFLGQINEHDRWLSHGWVIDTKRLDLQPV